MADITIDSMVAKPGIDRVTLQFEYSDPNTSPDQTALQIAAIDVVFGTVNDRDQANFSAEVATPFEQVALGLLAAEGARYFWARARDNSGNNGPWFPDSSTSGIQASPSRPANVAGMNFTLGNGQILFDVASPMATLSLKTQQGEDPSEDDPVFVNMLVGGSHVPIKVTTPLSLEFDGTANQSFGDNSTVTGDPLPLRLWIAFIYDGNTPHLAIWRSLAGNGEWQVPRRIGAGQGVFGVTNTSAVAAFMGAGTFYSDEALTDAAYTILGFVDWDDGTPVWANEASRITLYQNGTPLPGDIVKEAISANNSSTSYTGYIEHRIDRPVKTEGTPFEGGSVWTPDYPCNILDVQLRTRVWPEQPGLVILSMFHGTGLSPDLIYENSVNSARGYAPAQNVPVELSLDFRFRLSSDDLNTFFRIGFASYPSPAVAIWVNPQDSFANTYIDGAWETIVRRQEIMV